MTTEETELTFVRCPSCRSLVPAVATRCRMCGHTFDGAVDAAEEEDAPARQQKSRVRQRTMSVSREEVQNVASASAEENSAEDETAAEDFSFQDRFSEESGSEEKEEPDFDPMAALFGESPSTAESSSEEEEDSSDSQSSDTAFMDSLAALEEKETEDEDATLFAAPAESVEEPQTDSPESSEADEESESSSNEESEADEDAESQEAAGGERKRKRRRRRRKKKRPSEESELFAEGNESESEDKAEEVQEAEASSSEASAIEPEESSTAADESESQAAVSEQEEKVEETFFEKEDNMATQDVVEEHTNSVAPAQTSHAPEASGDKAGALVGWLVTYGPDGKGDSVEIRGGRFFIGRQKLRENDMVIGDSALSTPHCLVSAEASRGIQIQDLMSEQGTFVKKAGSKSFTQISDASLIEHGDMLRFGAYELLVCLIP